MTDAPEPPVGQSPAASPATPSFDPRLVLSSLSGESDAEWARSGAAYAGGAFLGGIALDEPSRDAARELVARDRSEFLPPDPIAWIDAELSALDGVPIQAGVNVRATDLDALEAAAEICADHDAIVEVNAHCRQPELKAVGCGETLLRDTKRLREYVQTATATGATVSVKVRTEVDGVDLPATARAVAAAGASIVHVDAMDSEPVVGAVVDALDGTDTGHSTTSNDATPHESRPVVIANNEVRDEASVQEYLAYGADAVSVGRPSTDPLVLERVHDALAATSTQA